MTSENYKKLSAEIREKNKNESYSYKQKIILEQQIFKDLPQKCVVCGKTDNLTLDHIIPKHILMSLGFDEQRTIIDDNYRILCAICNRMKTNFLDFREPKTKVILLRLLEKI